MDGIRWYHAPLLILVVVAAAVQRVIKWCRELFRRK